DMLLDFVEQVAVVDDLDGADALDEIADLQARLIGGAVGRHDGDPGAGARVAGLALEAEAAGRCHDLRRGAQADLLAIDDGEDDTRIFAVVVQADAAHRIRRQAARHALEGFAAVGRFVDAAALAPARDWIIDIEAIGQRLADVGIEAVALA